MLTIQKIQGGGRHPPYGVALIYAADKEFSLHGYPNNKYRVLCWNCNLSRGFYGYCPHEFPNKEYEYPGKSIKLEVINAYGGKCQICGETHWEFLTIDHIFGGGTQHRLELAKENTTIYKFLKDNNWPKDEYRLLCASCNCNVPANDLGRGRALP
jgi:hypothetical protein